jgi:hypothetical protein
MWGTWGIAPRIPYLGTVWKLAVSVTSRPYFFFGVKPPVSLQWKAGWTPIPIWTFWRREKPRALAEYRTECPLQFSLKHSTCSVSCSTETLQPLNVNSFTNSDTEQKYCIKKDYILHLPNCFFLNDASHKCNWLSNVCFPSGCSNYFDTYLLHEDKYPTVCILAE